MRYVNVVIGPVLCAVPEEHVRLRCRARFGGRALACNVSILITVCLTAADRGSFENLMATSVARQNGGSKNQGGLIETPSSRVVVSRTATFTETTIYHAPKPGILNSAATKILLLCKPREISKVLFKGSFKGMALLGVLYKPKGEL